MKTWPCWGPCSFVKQCYNIWHGVGPSCLLSTTSFFFSLFFILLLSLSVPPWSVHVTTILLSTLSTSFSPLYSVCHSKVPKMHLVDDPYVVWIFDSLVSNYCNKWYHQSVPHLSVSFFFTSRLSLFSDTTSSLSLCIFLFSGLVCWSLSVYIFNLFPSCLSSPSLPPCLPASVLSLWMWWVETDRG